MTPVDRELGELSQRVSQLERSTAVQTEILNEMRDLMIAARGSWKTVMAISGFAAALGGLAVKLIPFVPFK